MDDRDLLEAKYTAPSGKEFTFFWEKAKKRTNLKTGVFPFPDRDGAHVQHQGGGPVSFPMVCIFNGSDHILTATDFEAALLEREVAELQHPIYGIKKVIPTGDIERDEDFIESLNETHIKITFTETFTDEAAAPIAVMADELEELFEDFSEAAALEFAESIEVENIAEELLIVSALDTQANVLNENLSGLVSTNVSGASGSVNKQADFSTGMKELKNSLKTMLEKKENAIVKKLNTARLTLNLMKMPSRIIVNIAEKIKGYTGLITQIRGQFRADPFGIRNIKNAFSSTRLVLSGAVASMASGSALTIAAAASGSTRSAVTSTGIMSREAAIAAALQINDLLVDIQNFEDTKIKDNNFIDSNANSYLLLIELVYKSIQLILNASFALPMKRIIKLDRDRNFIELCAELYDSVDNYYLDKFIVENNFNIDELEIIPMGREVFYYVESA